MLSKGATSQWLGVSEWSLLLFALLVVAGLVEEHRHPWWHPRTELFALMVVIGCAGELLSDGGVFFFSRHLEALSNIEIEGLRLRTADAMDRASQADQRSEELEQRNLVLQSDVLKLQEAASWRDFSGPQRDKFISLTKKHLVRAPTFAISIDSVVGNPEAKRYGGQIAAALSAAFGVSVAEPRGLSSCVECTGVWVCINANSEGLSDDAKALTDLLKIAGVRSTKFCTDPRNGQGVNNIKIIVGPKE